MLFFSAFTELFFSAFSSGRVPWVPEPQNLNERKLVRGKERRKKGAFFLSFFLYFLSFFGSGTQGTGRGI